MPCFSICKIIHSTQMSLKWKRTSNESDMDGFEFIVSKLGPRQFQLKSNSSMCVLIATDKEDPSRVFTAKFMLNPLSAHASVGDRFDVCIVPSLETQKMAIDVNQVAQTVLFFAPVSVEFSIECLGWKPVDTCKVG